MLKKENEKSNRKFVNLSIEGSSSNVKFFREIFLVALENENIDVVQTEISMTVDDTIYVCSVNLFSFVFADSFKYIYGKDLRKDVFKEKIDTKAIMNLYIWSNSLFDKLECDMDEKDLLFEEIKEKLKTDKVYNNQMRSQVINVIENLPYSKRKSYIERFEDFEILAEEDRIALGYYADYPPNQLKRIFEQKGFSESDKETVIIDAMNLEINRMLTKKEKGIFDDRSRKKYMDKMIKLTDLLTAEYIIDLYIENILAQEEFIKTKVKKEDILNCSYNKLVKFLSNVNSSLPEQLQITSRDLVFQYGKNLNGMNIYSLVTYGYIDSKDLIEVYNINKALKATGYEENVYEDEELRAYYIPEILIDMKKKDVLSPDFVEKYLELLDIQNNPEIFAQKSQFLVEKLKKENNINVQEEVLQFFNIGLCDTKIAQDNISSQYIEEKYINGEITIEEVFEYYQKGLIGDEAISQYYEEDEIFELYEQGKINGLCLSAIKDTDKLIEAFVDSKIKDEDFLRLYLVSNRLSVEELNEGLQFAEKEINIINFINQTTPFEKIKELFTTFLIDIASINILHSQKIISDDELEDIKNSVDVKKFINVLSNGATFRVSTSRKGSRTSNNRKIKPQSTVTHDFSLEIDLISRLLGKTCNEEELAKIESYNFDGKPTTLNGYKIWFGGDIIIFRKSESENAVFLMSPLQAMYFLYGKETESGKFDIQDKMKDKAHLREIDGVEVLDHSKHFGRNLVKAAAKISPTVANNIKGTNQKYSAQVQSMIDNMRQQYLDEKSK